MPSLGETTAMLARLRAAGTNSPSAGGLMQSIEEFGPNPGRLIMLTYRPAQLESGAPLVVVLHGCTQSAEAYAANAGWLALAERFGFVVSAPQQSHANNPNRCFNWFAPGDVARGGGEAASIAVMVPDAVAEHGLDPARVFITGLSAGGAMTAAMLASYTELFAGGAIIAGLPYGVAKNVQEAMKVMGRPDGRSGAALGASVPVRPGARTPPRLAIWHGDADHVVNVGNADDIARQWAAVLGLPSEAREKSDVTGATRSTWRPDGEVLIELNIVSGMGHGTPLATKTNDPVGAIAPFMLKAGVSSSLEITRFWKIDPVVASGSSPYGGPPRAPETPAEIPSSSAPSGSHASIGSGVMAAIAHIPASVQDIVAKALRGSGLLK